MNVVCSTENVRRDVYFLLNALSVNLLYKCSSNILSRVALNFEIHLILHPSLSSSHSEKKKTYEFQILSCHLFSYRLLVPTIDMLYGSAGNKRGARLTRQSISIFIFKARVGISFCICKISALRKLTAKM